MNYVPTTDLERTQMLSDINVSSIDDLFCDIPESVRLKDPLKLPNGKSEQEVFRQIKALASSNKIYDVIMCGAGAYNHFIPPIVNAVVSKEEFVTSYTPYQPEISQGILQSIFEYQTMICRLTGMDVSNASVYDGATAAAEAVAMCRTRPGCSVFISGGVNPQTVETINTYCFGSGDKISKIPLSGGLTDISSIDKTASCIVLQQPNYFGLIEDVEAITKKAHTLGLKVIVVCNPIATALFKTPGECGADIAVGDAQPLGIPLSYGGPYIGFMACTKELIRKLPGRIVGQTTDTHSNRAFVLTLQAREQHIRREKALSNICSNQALCAMRVAVYLSALGTSGLTNVASQCADKAHYAASMLCSIPGVSLKYENEFFHEFVTVVPVEPEEILKALASHGMLGGLPVKEGILWCFTEQNTKADIDRAVELVKGVCTL